MQYTDDQQKAIDTRDKNILVAAAAGSGKTRVLVDRIIKQLLAGEFNVDEILVVTFTNAAAAEMRERIDMALQKKLQEVTDSKIAARLERQLILLTGANISTFHSFCQRLIRQHIDMVDADPQFRLASEQELLLLKHETLEDLLESKYQRPEVEEKLPAWEAFINFVDAYGNDHGDDKVAEAVLNLYNFSQSQPFPQDWLARQQFNYDVNDSFDDLPWLNRLLPEIKQNFKAIVTEYEKVKSLVNAASPASLAIAWEPYLAIIEGDFIILDDIAGSLQQLLNNPKAGAWNNLYESLNKIKFKRLTNSKEYRALKEEAPEIRTAFDNYRNQMKTDLKKKITEKYFTDDEQALVNGVKECAPLVAVYTKLVIDFMAALQKAKKERNVLDFNDLEHYALNILCADAEKLQQPVPEYVPTEAALGYQEQFKAIMVDEYQDTNSVQEAIINLLARANNLFTVGDVKQSIYRFRLADPYLFQQKYENYAKNPADKMNQLITMKQNFRSRAEVLAPINFIFDQIMTKEAAEIEYDANSKLYPGADYPSQSNTLQGPMELDIVICGNSTEKLTDNSGDDTADGDDLKGFELEASYVASKITKLIEQQKMVFDSDLGGYRPLQYRDIVVLLRSLKGKGDILLEALRKSSIPAYAESNGGYFEAAEVRLMLDLLTIVDNARQDIPLAAILASPIGGFSMEELVKIRLAAKDGDLYDGLLASFSEEHGLAKELAERTAAFQQILANWRSYAINHSVPELVWQLYRDTGYYDYVGSLKGGLLKQANLRMLADRAADYEKTNYRGLFRFLRFMENLQKRDTDLAAARTLGASEDVVRIMTIHKSKGLEFPVVIIADSAKKFNLKDANKTFLMHQKLGVGLKVVERSEAGRQTYNNLAWRSISEQLIAESKAEEMRILYVAMTRAREKLIITGTAKADSWEKKQKEWSKGLSCEAIQLPAKQIQQANSYLDWIAAAIVRHADGEKLAAADAGNCRLMIEPEAHFAVTLIPANKAITVSTEAAKEDEILEAVQNLRAMPESPKKAWVENCLSWKYDMHGLDKVPAKLSVTELKERFAETEVLEDSINGTVMLPLDDYEKAADIEWPEPKFLQTGTQKLSAAQRGTIMHTVMQHLDMKGDISYKGIKAQIAGMEKSGLLNPGEGDIVYIKSVQGFINSLIGMRLQKAKAVWKELPFSRMLMAKRFFAEVADEKEQVFTQGVIDLLFEDEDGKLVLLDYKTDRSDDAAKIKKRYQVQLGIYSEAVEAILGRSLDEKYVYLLQSNKLIAM